MNSTQKYGRILGTVTGIRRNNTYRPMIKIISNADLKSSSKFKVMNFFQTQIKQGMSPKPSSDLLHGFTMSKLLLVSLSLSAEQFNQATQTNISAKHLSGASQLSISVEHLS